MLTYTSLSMAGLLPPDGGGAVGGYPSPTPTVCPLCLAHRDDMMTLDCNHHFCKRCLNQRTDGNLLKCPSCDHLMDLHDHGLEGLQGGSNYLINNILSLVSMPGDSLHPSALISTASTNLSNTSQTLSWSIESSETRCQLCRLDISASRYCVGCKMSLCSGCIATHQHDQSSIIQQLAPPLDQRAVHLHHSYCSTHHHETLDFCCKHCTQAVCRKCVLQEHIGHTILRLSEAADEFKKMMPSIVQDLKTKGDCVNNILTQVEHGIESIDNRAKTVGGEVQSCIRANILALEDKERELLLQVENVRKTKRDILVSQKSQLNLVKNHLVEAASMVINAQQAQHHTELVNIEQGLQKLVSKIQGDINQLNICHEDDYIEFTLRDHPLRSSISQLGAIHSGISSRHTTASGHGVYCAIVGKYAKFMVTCRNHCNKKIARPREAVDVKIYGPDASPVTVECVTKSDGVCHYQYCPLTTGTYIVSIQVRGRHIGESPMKVKVRKRRNYFNIGDSDHQIGTDGEQEGQLCRPWGICCDPYGNIIVADRSNNRVQIFNADGSYKLKFGETGTALGQFNRPASVAVNSLNHIIVTDKDNHRIQVFTSEGKFLHAFGERGSMNGQLHYPWDVACNAEDRILVSDTRNHRIQLFSSAGIYLHKFSFHSPSHQRMQLPQPRGVCFTESGDILVTDFNKHKLMFLRYDLQPLQMIGNEGQGNSQFFRPQGVAVDLEGNILVSEGRNNRVQIFRPDGTFLTKFGSLGSGSGEFDRPSGICVTPDGYIVVVDFGNNRIMFF